jgi:hypothetical protein
MELLLSNMAPAKISKYTQQVVWADNLKRADSLKIATGYVSADALIELKKVIELNSRPHIDLLIGMHYFDKFTKPQYDAAILLNEVLSSKGLGAIYLSNARKFHGKMYSFSTDRKCFGAFVGSSNLSSIFDGSDNLYEVDCLFQEEIYTQKIDNTISELIKKLGTKISELPAITDFRTNNSLLENHYGVEKISHQKLADIVSTKTGTKFYIPLKTEPKSNLNAYFGKGRENKKGFVMPRPWYEVELIVSKKITELPNYPFKRKFKVYTDDGWAFDCTTNGDFAKNFRSYDDLKILGKWIKGRLEHDGALKIGNPITNEVLDLYGVHEIILCATEDDTIWTLEFKKNNICSF